MVMNRTIQVRMTKDQYERIKTDTHTRGFDSMSAFMRFAALQQDFVLFQKVCEIHTHLLGTTKKAVKKNPLV